MEYNKSVLLELLQQDTLFLLKREKRKFVSSGKSSALYRVGSFHIPSSTAFSNSSLVQGLRIIQ